jgi:hypothetical protein
MTSNNVCSQAARDGLIQFISLIEGSGSRVTFILNGQRADFHRPHPGKETLRYRVKDVREFLQRAGVTP